MLLIRVFDDTRGAGRCGTCMREVTWYTLADASGSRRRFDLDPVALKSEHDPGTRRLILYLDPDDVHPCPR